MAASVVRPSEWVTHKQVEDLSRARGETEELRGRRLRAYERFLELPIEPNPLYRGYGYFTNVDLSGIDAEALGPAVQLPPAPDGVVRVVHDAGGTHVTVPPVLRDAGLTVTPLAPHGSMCRRGMARRLAAQKDPPTVSRRSPTLSSTGATTSRSRTG